MSPILLETTFWEVVGWLIIVFFWTMAIWMFISIFADIFRRGDLSGWGKAGWIFVLFVLPFLGALIYICMRPRDAGPPPSTYASVAPYAQANPYPAASAMDEIAKAQALLQSGGITQDEFEAIKARALA